MVKKIITAVVLIMMTLPVSVFGSDGELTRMEFISVIMRELKLEAREDAVAISDLPQSDKDYNYAVSAVQNGIISGYGNGNIKPYAPIKREDVLVILSRAYNIAAAEERYLAKIADKGDISDYARGAVAGIIKNKIIETEGKLLPKGYITAAEAEELVALFKKHSQKQLSFSYGYPRLSKDSVRDKISVELKTTLPCVVYYTLVPNSSEFSEYTPAKNEIDNFLTSIAVSDEVIDVNISPEDKYEYNLYIMAVDKSSKKYTMAVIEQVRAHSYTAGDGTAENPYKIYDEEQLKSMKYHPDSCFSLENDIALTEAWKPIEAVFSGELDGNYHKITNININDNKDNSGLFREIRGGGVKRLYLDATVYGRDGTGIIAGINGGEISECFVTGRIHSEQNNVGAIVGINEGIIENSVSAAYLLEAKGYAGGIAGSNRGGRIENCISAVYSVSANMYASGVAGVNTGGIIKNTVCANFYADDVISAKSGRITTNKEDGICENNYCYDKMISDSEVIFGYDTHDGLEASWQELTDRDFYRDALGWDTELLWTGGIDEDFRLPLQSGFETADMIKGITMYAPIKISDAEGLRAIKDEPNMHYILTADIDLNGKNWEVIADDGTAEHGFGGTLDGNNHIVSNMHIATSAITNYGMFGVISSGTVRNLTLNNLTIEGVSLAGGIAAANYGYIENCSVNGKIYALRKDNMLSVGGICGNNYGFIENSKADMKIRADGVVLTIGGIAANNEGYINNTEFNGSLYGELSEEYSNAVAGGICGINISGVIYNSLAEPRISTKASTNYVGGIVGIASGGEVYKTSSSGEAIIYSEAYSGATAYAGGIAGLAPSGLIMNSHSDMSISAESNAVYAGGIVGYNMNSSVQNTYSMSNIDILGRRVTMDAPCFMGGICGYSEGGFISDSVAMNEKIEGNGVTALIGNSADELAMYANNYAADDIKMGGIQLEFSHNGEKKPSASIKKSDFFFKPISEGGALGWTEGDVWYNAEGHDLPILCGIGCGF